MPSEKTKPLLIKGPDLFQVKVSEFLIRLSQNPKPLLAVIGLVVALFAVAYGVRFFSLQKQDTRRGELSKVDLVFEGELKTYTTQREELEKKRDVLKAAQPTPAGTDKEPAKPVADNAEIKALDAQIQAMKPDHKASAEQYKNYFQKYPKSAEGHLAGLKYASYAAEQDQLEDAQKVLEDIVNGPQEAALIQTQSLLLLISILEDRNELDKALTYADKFIQRASVELKPRALLVKGQLYFLKKDYAGAQSTLNQVLSDHEFSLEADRARSLLALIPQ